MEPKLLDLVRQTIRMRHYSPRTEEAYVHWIRRYIVFHRKRHPREMGAAEISQFLGWLALEQQVSASTQNQALSALLFLYRDVLGVDPGILERVPRALAPVRVPVVLSRDEVRRVLDRLAGVPHLVAALLYGCGLRLQECLELRVKDLDFDTNQITVRRGKGQKDRRTMLPAAMKGRCRRTSLTFGGSTRLILRVVKGGSFCRERSTGSTQTRPASGRGSSCFLPGVCVETQSSGRRPAFICTRASSSGR